MEKILKHPAVIAVAASLGITWGYHNGYLDVLPGFGGPKVVKK